MIRTMKITDYQQVYDVWTSCRGMGLNSIDDTQEGIDRFLKRNPATCFVAEEADKIIGVILSGHDGRRGYIYHTAVHPEKRGKGIGRMLVDASIQALKKKASPRRHWWSLHAMHRETVSGRNRAFPQGMIWYIVIKHCRKWCVWIHRHPFLYKNEYNKPALP